MRSRSTGLLRWQVEIYTPSLTSDVELCRANILLMNLALDGLQ